MMLVKGVIWTLMSKGIGGERKLEGLWAHQRAEAAATQIGEFSLMLADGCRPCQLY